MANESRVVIRGEDRASEAFRSVERSAKSFGTKIFEVTTTVSSLINITQTAARVVTSLASAMAEPVRQALDAEKAQTLLAAKVRATGAAAGYSVGELNSLASSMAKVTTFGDDAIVSAEGLLLQYQNITRAGGVFERALNLSADLAEAMGTDLNDAVVKVGKALNDPADKLESLSKIGVSFTEVEQNVIVAMAAANDVAGAQNAILSKLESTVGGTAEAMRGSFGGALSTVKNAWDDLLENIGKFITESPAIQAAIQKAADLINQWSAALVEGSGPMNTFRQWFEETVSIAIPAMVRGISVLIGGMFELSAAAIRLGGFLTDAFTKPRTFLADAAAGLVEIERRLKLISDSEAAIRMNEIGEASGYWGESARSAADRAAEGMQGLKAVVQDALSVAADQLENLDLTSKATINVAAATEKATKKVSMFAGVIKAFEKAKSFLRMADDARRAGDAFEDAGEKFQSSFKPSGPGPVDLINDANAGLVEFGEFAWNGQAALEATTDAAEDLVEAVEQASQETGVTVENTEELAEAIRAAEEEWNRSVEGMSDNTADAFSDAFAQAFAGMNSLQEGLYSFTQTLREQMAHAFLDPILGAQSPIAQLFNPVFNTLKQIGSAIATNFIQPLITGILQFFGVKTAGETAASQTAAGLQIAAIGEVALAQQAVMTSMGPPLAALASAALVASFGTAAAAAGALPGILAAGAAAGAAASVPALADGGRVTRPTRVLIGEAGAETVVPETRPRRARELLEDLFARQPGLAPGARGARSARPITVQNYVTIQGTPDDPEAVAERIYDAINKKLGRELRGR